MLLRKYTLSPFLAFLIMAGQTVFSQSDAPCGQSHYIEIPFVKDTGTYRRAAFQNIVQKTTYQKKDAYSFWYKMVVKEETFINCQIKPIQNDDEYAVYIYRYKEDDFCDKVFNDKIKPVKVEAGDKKRSYIKAASDSDFEFKAKANDVFYFFVLTVSEKNCGHQLRLASGSDTLVIQALHFPCTNEPEKPKEVVVKKEPNLPKLKKPETIIVSVKEPDKEHKKVKATVKITDLSTKKAIRLDSTEITFTRASIEKGKKYNVTCNATGYKTFNHDMIVSEYVSPDSNLFIIYLKPLKAGDNFVMEDIYFYPNTYALKDESFNSLNGLKEFMLENPDLKIELQGHTNGNNKYKGSKENKSKGPGWDFSGSAKKLSLLRAETIKKYLVDSGVNEKNISTVGFGGDKMIVADPKSPEALKKNVRVEVVIVDDGSKGL